MGKTIVVSGKRKSSVAKAKISSGMGNVLFNGKPYNNLRLFHKLSLMEPIEITREFLGNFDFDIEVSATGGGTEGQIQAARLAIAKAIVKFTENEELKKTMTKYDRNMLVADVRRKEAYKPGDSKARARRQSSYR